MSVSLLELFKQIPDWRKASGKRYELEYVLLFSVFAMLCNQKTYAHIGIWIKAKHKTLNKIFKLKWKRTPSKSIIQDIFSKLNIMDLEKVFREYSKKLLKEMVEKKKDQNKSSSKTLKLAIYAKTLKGSYNKIDNKSPLQLLSVFATEHEIILAHVDIQDKGENKKNTKNHEIPATREVIKDIDNMVKELGLGKNIIYTMDALHC